MPDIAIHVRRAVLADADALGDVHVRVWRWAYRSLMPDDFLHRLRADRRADHWRQDLAGDGITVWVAEVEHAIVGFAGSIDAGYDDVPPSTAELAMVNVLEEYHGRGVGRALLAAVEDHWQVAGYTHAVLWVFEANLRAQTFYARAGWAPDGVTRGVDFGGTDLPERRMIRRLRQPEA